MEVRNTVYAERVYGCSDPDPHRYPQPQYQRIHQNIRNSLGLRKFLQKENKKVSDVWWTYHGVCMRTYNASGTPSMDNLDFEMKPLIGRSIGERLTLLTYLTASAIYHDQSIFN